MDASCKRYGEKLVKCNPALRVIRFTASAIANAIRNRVVSITVPFRAGFSSSEMRNVHFRFNVNDKTRPAP